MRLGGLGLGGLLGRLGGLDGPGRPPLAESSGGPLLDCAGLGLGVLFSIGIFQALESCWLVDCLHTARYDARDLLHTVSRVSARDFLPPSRRAVKDVDYRLWRPPLVAPLCIYQPNGSSAPRDGPATHRPVSRQRAAADVIDHVQAAFRGRRRRAAPQSGLRTAFAEANGSAMTSESYNLDDYRGRGTMPWQDRDESAAWRGRGRRLARRPPLHRRVPSELRRYFRPQLVLGGAVLTAYQQKWRTENTVVPANTTFMIHRYREFIMLMIGESMLQLVIAEHKQEEAAVDGRIRQRQLGRHDQLLRRHGERR